MTCEDGHYYILGRLGDMVIGENGENINPDTVEKHFRLDGAKMMSVLGLDGKNGQELSLILQIAPYATAAQLAALKDEAYAINDTLPTAMAVRNIYVTRDELAPPTAVKVSRTQLLKKIQDGAVTLTPIADATAQAETTGEMSPLMREICQIIAKELELPPDGVTENAHIFHDLGATSMQYFAIVSALAAHFSLSDYDKGDTYRYTPKEICDYIERHL